MPWYTAYIESPEFEKFSRREAEHKLSPVISDWENCMAEAKTRIWNRFSSSAAPSGNNYAAYINTVYRNKLEDIRREECGRPRTPVAMKAEGSPITDIFNLYCLEKYSTTEISYRLDLPRATVARWTGWLANNKKCPKRLQVVSSYASSDDSIKLEEFSLDYADSDSANPVEDHWSDSEQLSPVRRLLLQAASTVDDQSDSDYPVEDESELMQWSEKLTLSDEEALILRLRYIESNTVRKAAKVLNISPITLRNREAALLLRLRDVIA